MNSHHEWVKEVTAQHDAQKPFSPENGQPLRFRVGDRSKSYWHGWCNGMMDKGRLAIDEPARNLAAECVRRQRAH